MQFSSAGVEYTCSLMSGDSEILLKLPRYQMMKHLKLPSSDIQNAYCRQFYHLNGLKWSVAAFTACYSY